MSLPDQQPLLPAAGVHDARLPRIFVACTPSATVRLLFATMLFNFAAALGTVAVADGAQELTPAAASVSAGAAGGAAQIGDGQALYTANCSGCHQANGEGLTGVFPPLRGSGAVNNPDPTHQIHAVLFGAQGLTIGGVKYASSMPPFLQLSDQDVADLIDYVRSASGNHGRPITAAEVTAARARGQ